jgi:regulator of replication initiation timing|tara:strand:- start:287 stop:484 length:198 start_codon:yes stop_codon:yes gene_type:complete
MKNLQQERDELKKKYDRTFAAHTTKYNKHIASEGEYRDSAQKVMNIYDELFKVSEELGEPIPMWF